MKARHFGASSYDDEYDEEEEMDMSGFIGSTTTEQPPVIERKRAARVPPINEGLGNMGPRSVPPPQPRMSNIGYAPPMVTSAANNDGSPWNPLWAHDETLGPNWLPVVSKTGGLGLVGSSVLLARGLDWGPRTKMMAFTGALMYAHPVLGIRQGMLGRYLNESNWFVKLLGGGSAHVLPLGTYFVYRRHIRQK